MPPNDLNPRPTGHPCVVRSAPSTRVVAPVLAVAMALGLAGCATPVSHPAVDVPTSFAAAAPSDADVEATWWEAFHDPVLTELVRRAETENRDVRIAAERLRAARAR
jgi:multidrug efflux system outer membrane protein